ncbi:MAG: Hsp20/alpha crystallin family protein [bacterium]|nr:Hsp20/alpha crystallin family protein [bacterium]MDT8365970.1 Hsp20/alpha crystallin family protein [bacterium]
MQIERYRGGRPVYYRPFFGLRGLQDEMNRVFSDFYDDTGEKTVAAFNPAVDIVDTVEDLQVKVELPGVKKEDVEVTLKDDVLSIKGEKNEEREEKGENRYYVERSFGSFSRSVTLPSNVKTDKVKATFVDGVLRIILPKAEEEKEKLVQISVD